MFLRSSLSLRGLLGVAAGAAVAFALGGHAMATAIPSSVVIDNFSQDAVGAAPSEVNAYNGQTITVVSSGTADGNMLQVTDPHQYYAGLQFQTAGTTPENWDSYQNITFDLLFPSTGYAGTSIDIASMYYQGGSQPSSVTGSPSITVNVPTSNPSTTLVPVTVPISAITPAISPASWFQILPNIYPNTGGTGSGPWTFDIGNIQFTNPNPIPEPTTIALFVVAGAGLLLIGRRRRSA